MMVFSRAMSVVWVALFFTVTVRLGGAGPQTHQDAESATGHKLQEKGIPNFGEITPTLYRGGQPNTDGYKALARMGINIVVDAHAASKSEEEKVQALGMRYVAIPWHCPWPRDKVFAKFLKLLHENKGKKIFVHCRLGDDRTGMMTAAYRMAEEGWSADEAMKEMRAFGFSQAHHYICPGLARYEREFPERLKNSPAFKGLRSMHN